MARSSSDLAARRRFIDSAERLTSFIATVSNGARYVLRADDQHITKSLFIKAARGEMKLLPRSISVLQATGNWTRDGGTFVEAGANIGTTTVTAMQLGRFSRAVVCEPEPINFSLLELNVIANLLEREVMALPVAGGDIDGEIELLVVPHRSGVHEVLLPDAKPPGFGQYTTMRVRQVAFDTLAAEGVFDPDEVTMLWMDIQGHEGHVLRGASELTARGVPVVMELDPSALNRHGGLELLREIGRRDYTHYVSMRRIRGGTEMKFDLDTIEDLDKEIKWLFEHHRFTDVLLLRDPVRRPREGGLPMQVKNRPVAVPAEPWATDGAAEQQAEGRRAFVEAAREYASAVAAELPGGTVLVRPGESAEEELFVEQSGERLRALEGALEALDELGQDVRGRPFVDLHAGVGAGVIAALTRHGFQEAAAVEGDLDAYTILKVNRALNELDFPTLAATVPETSADDLVARGLLPPEPGVLWAEHAEALTAGAGELLASGCPLVVRGAPPLDDYEQTPLGDDYVLLVRRR